MGDHRLWRRRLGPSGPCGNTLVWCGERDQWRVRQGNFNGSMDELSQPGATLKAPIDTCYSVPGLEAGTDCFWYPQSIPSWNHYFPQSLLEKERGS